MDCLHEKRTCAIYHLNSLNLSSKWCLTTRSKGNHQYDTRILSTYALIIPPLILQGLHESNMINTQISPFTRGNKRMHLSFGIIRSLNQLFDLSWEYQTSILLLLDISQLQCGIFEHEIFKISWINHIWTRLNLPHCCFTSQPYFTPSTF